MKVVVVGGGVAGLTAALRLARAGHAVTVLEREASPGGLARSFAFGGGWLDCYYHFVCRADHELFGLLRELGIGDRLVWTRSRMGQFHRGVLYPFSDPWDLIRFSPFSPLERLRFGVAILGVKARPRDGWRSIADLTAAEWLAARMGRRAYEVIYEPLLRLKFGRYAERLSAAWIWARFHRIGTSRTRLTQREVLGYLEGGMRTLVDRLAGEIARAGGRLLPGTPAAGLEIRSGAVRGVSTPDGDHAADAVISTVPPATLLRLVGSQPAPGLDALRRVEHIGVVCVLLVLERPYSPFFWTNISDPGIPLAGIVEFTRLNPRLLPGGGHVVYLPSYLRADDTRFFAADEVILADAVAWLAHLNPEFDAGWVRQGFVFRDPFAQPICEVGFGRAIPPMSGAIRGLVVTDSSQLHPEDRTVSNSIGLGARAAREVLARR